MKNHQATNRPAVIQHRYYIVLVLLSVGQLCIAQPATVGNPLAIGQDCGGGGSNFKSFSYDSASKLLVQVGPDCFPDLASPGFNPGGGSISFSPKDQKLFYIETTTGNNSIVWSWTPGVCPSAAQAPIYTYSNTFIVGLEFNAITGDGYQLEFSTGSAPYDIFLRKVTSFGPPLVAGSPQQILLPAGVNIYQQNGDVVITPTGKMYFVLDNKMFNLDYSTYGSGTLNATFIDTLQNGPGNNVIGLSYTNGNFIASVLGSSCSYKQIDISSGSALVQNVGLAAGSFVSYDMATMVTGIGAAKKIASLSVTGPNQYQVNYDVKVKNYGNVDLNTVQLVDSVASVFGSTFINASVAPVGTLPAGLGINPGFDGQSDAKIFITGSTMKASPADSAIVRVTVNLNNPDKTVTYLNSAIASATGAIFSNLVRDSSDNQMTLNPDTSGTDVPDVFGEGVPTPLTPDLWLLLPNKLVNFNGSRSGKGITLNWTLGNPEEVETIFVQRSFDGISFKTIAQINCNYQIKQQYAYLDAVASPEANYYRLIVVSTGGRRLYSGTLQFRKQPDMPELTVSPNPFINLIQFQISLEKATVIKYKISDYAGHIIKTGQYNGHQGSNLVGIDAGSLTAGFYILEVNATDKHYYNKTLKL